MKYLSPEYLGEMQALGELPTEEVVSAEVVEATEGTTEAYAIPVAAPAIADPSGQVGVWTGTMAIFTWVVAIIGGYGVMSSLWGMWGLVYLESNVESISKLAARIPALKTSQLALEAQLQNIGLMWVSMVFKLIVSIGFVAGSKMLNKRVENANMFVVMVCGMAILYGVVAAVIGFMAMPDMSLMPKMNAQAASLATNIAMVFVAVGVLMKAGFYGGIMAYMCSKNSRLLYAPRTPSIQPLN